MARQVFMVCILGFALGIASWGQALAKNGVYTHRATGMTLTIKRVVVDYKGAEFEHPKKRHKYVALYITISNGSRSAHNYNPLDISLIDPAGESFEETFVSLDKFSPDIHFQKIAAHRFRSGWVLYELPSKVHKITVTWSDSDTLDPAAEIAHYPLG